MRFWRRLSIRWRITIGSVLVAAILLVVAAFGFRQQIQQVQVNSDKKILYGASTPYIAQIQHHPASIDKPAGEEHVAVLNPDGTIVVSNLPDIVADRIATLRTYSAGSHFLTIGHAQYLVTVETVKTTAGKWHIVATRDQEPTAVVLANLTNILIIGAAVLIIGFGIASWSLTTAALRPVNRMRRRADQLRRSGADEPLPVGPARDELSALAITLNELIGSVRDTAAREKQMVSDASHELRTPIAVLKAQLELAHLSEGDSAALANDLAAAEESVGRLSMLATSLLELSALESDPGAHSTSWADVTSEFATASDRARLLGTRQGVFVDFEDPVDGDPHSYAISTTHFGEVLDNLVSNGIRAASSGGHVAVELAQTEARLQLTVCDSGPGMPESFIPIAFDRFSRPDAERGDAAGGSGLGLSIVAAIVANAGGSIELANQPSGGLVVTVIIPATAETT